LLFLTIKIKTMSSTDEFESVYTGSEVNVKYLQGLLEEQGISTRVRDDFQSGLRGGFGGGLPGQVQLLVPASQLTKAKQIAEETFPGDKS
jgi:hypothetical protein